MRSTDPRNDSTHRRRTDTASGGWREEYRYSHATLPDGGEPHHALPAPGDRVRDRDGEDDELLVVATHPDTPAEEYRIDALDGLTVAEVNEPYDARAPVVEAVYLDEAIHTTNPDADLADVRAAVDAGAITAYSFPASRLASIDADDGSPTRTQSASGTPARGRGEGRGGRGA